MDASSALLPRHIVGKIMEVVMLKNLQAFSELGMDIPVIKSFKNVETLPACLFENQVK